MGESKDKKDAKKRSFLGTLLQKLDDKMKEQVKNKDCCNPTGGSKGDACCK